MSAIKTYTPKTLAKEIKSAVKWLKKEDCGCVTLKLNGTLAVCVGWSDGFDPDDETVIHSKTSPTYGICAAIKAWAAMTSAPTLTGLMLPTTKMGASTTPSSRFLQMRTTNGSQKTSWTNLIF